MNKSIPWSIIIKKFKCEISVDELTTLNSWLEVDENRTVYVEMQVLWDSILQEGSAYKSNADQLWKQMEIRMERKQIKQIHFSLNKFRWMSVAASVLFLMMFSFSVYVAKQWYNANTIALHYNCMNGKSRVTLPDGSVVWLHSESSIEYKSKPFEKQRNVRLVGEAYFNVKKDPEKPFIVKALNFEVKVYGTTFNVEAREGAENMSVSLLSGSVAVKSANKNTMIIPGEVAVCTKNTGAINVEKQDVNFSAMWANESIRFERKSIKELSKYLSKWYGVKIILDSSIPENQAYTFTIKHEPFEEILRLMARTNPITYNFNEKNVVKISRKSN